MAVAEAPPPTPTPPSPVRLLRSLGPVIAVSIVVGNLIGSGIFLKPQAVAADVPNFSLVVLVWVLGGVMALFGATALAEVAALFPRTGGKYAYLHEAFGPFFAFLYGWVNFWVGRSASFAALSTAAVMSFHDVLRVVYDLPAGGSVFHFWEERFLGVALLAVLAWVNIRGVRWGGMLQLALSFIKVASLLTIILLPFLIRGPVASSPSSPGAGGDATFTWVGLFAASLSIIWVYRGWSNLPAIAEEVRQPERNIPFAMLTGVWLAIFLFLGVNAAFHWVIPLDQMRELPKSMTVTTQFCLRLLGPIGAAVAAAIVMFAVLGTLSATAISAPRVYYAMGRDKLAPRAFGSVHSRFHTPAWAIAIQTSWAAVLLLIGAAMTRIQLPVLHLSEQFTIDLNLPTGKRLFDLLTDLSVFASLTFDTLAVASIFVFRARLPNAQRKFRCWGYPIVPILFVSHMAVVAVATVLTNTVAIYGLGFIFLGAVVYAVFLRAPRRGADGA